MLKWFKTPGRSSGAYHVEQLAGFGIAQGFIHQKAAGRVFIDDRVLLYDQDTVIGKFHDRPILFFRRDFQIVVENNP